MTDSRKPITVLQLCEHFGGRKASLHGVARSFQWWIPAFDSTKYRVLLCSRKRRDRAADEMERAGLNPIFLGYGKIDPRNLFALLRLIRKEKVDLIHAHGYGACTWGRLAGWLKGIPVLVHERCNYTSVPLYQRPVEWLLAPITQKALAVSESSRRFCIEKRYMKPDIVETLYNGLLMEDIPRVDSGWISEFRQDRGLTPNHQLIGIVGRLESHKGHIDAFQALLRVRESCPDVRLWVLGDGAESDSLQQWVAAHGLSDIVDFLGFRRDVRKVIRCFDVQLFPSHMEGTPNTLFEALAVGNPVVASTADGQGEILFHEDTALLFEPGDHDMMAHHLVRILEDEPLRTHLARRSLDRAPDFDGRNTIRTMESIYDRMVNHGLDSALPNRNQ